MTFGIILIGIIFHYVKITRVTFLRGRERKHLEIFWYNLAGFVAFIKTSKRVDRIELRLFTTITRRAIDNDIGISTRI